MLVTRACVLAISFVVIIYCLQVIPERAYISYANPKYIENCSIQVRRYNRKSPYYLNWQGILKHSWNNNVSIHIVTYEHLHNEYRRSFVEVHGPICDFVNKDIFFGAVFRKFGVSCPTVAGPMALNNLTLDIENFPYEFPFSKCLLNVSYDITKTKEVIMVAHIYTTFKKNGKNKP